jgi:hypothetical protein
VDADVFDVDLFDTPAEQVRRLRERGRRLVCYMSAGTFEPWRPDRDRYPAAILGRPVEGFPDERWIDVRRLDVLGPVLAARLDLCKSKGFDAIEPDNVDAYANDSGFPITAGDQLVFNRWLAEQAHARGLAVALKNDLEQVPDLVDAFDFAVNEECVAFDECDALIPFIRAEKPVLHVEYDVPAAEFCPVVVPLGFSSMGKHRSLDAWRDPC